MARPHWLAKAVPNSVPSDGLKNPGNYCWGKNASTEETVIIIGEEQTHHPEVLFSVPPLPGDEKYGMGDGVGVRGEGASEQDT